MRGSRQDLEIVGLKDRAHAATGQAQRRRAAARGHCPRHRQPARMLIFDEPTASLDGDTGRNDSAVREDEVLNGHRDAS